MLIFQKFCLFLLEILDVVVISKGLGGNEIDVLFRGSEFPDQSVPKVWVPDCEDWVGDETPSKANREEGIWVVEKEGNA